MLIIYQIKVVKFQKYFKTYLIKYNKLLIEFDLTASLKYEKYHTIFFGDEALYGRKSLVSLTSLRNSM